MWSVSGLAPLSSESKNSTAGVSVSATAEMTVYVHSVRCRTSAVAVPIVSGCVSTITLPPQLVPARHDHASPGAAPAHPGGAEGEGPARCHGMRRTRGAVGADSARGADLAAAAASALSAASCATRTISQASAYRSAPVDHLQRSRRAHNGMSQRCAIMNLACRKLCGVRRALCQGTTHGVACRMLCGMLQPDVT